MSNTTLTADIIADKALDILENNLVAANLVYRGYEDEFDRNVNGYKIGDTVSVRRPAQFTVRTGPTMALQDVMEGKFAITVDTQAGVDFKFTASDLTLKIEDLSERIMKPAMLQLANSVDLSLMLLYKKVWNWVGTPGQTINSFADFGKGPERLDKCAVPQDDRASLLSPSDYWGMLGSQTALFLQNAGNDAYRRAKLGMIGNVDTYMSQNISTHTTGDTSSNGTVVSNGTAAANSTTWTASKDTGTMSLITDGWTAAKAVVEGDVFTIATVFAVNPVTKATEDYLQPFVVRTAATADGSGNMTITVSPPIITSGSQQTVSNAPADASALVFLGTAATAYKQNMVFHKNAFALTMVPMELPPGAMNPSRRSYKGMSVRVIPVYDGINDTSSWRLDILYGVKAIDARLATRLSGTP